jgi:chromosome partitioning protein
MDHQIPHGILIAVGNQKGGVGKTTVCIHVAAALGLRGYRCLVIDLDPAAGATRHLGIPENSFAGSLELITTDETIDVLAITEGMPKGVHLIPSRPQLSELDTLLSKFVDRTTILDRGVRIARQMYDFIFLDTPPSAAAITTVAAYSVAEWFLLSAFPHPLSIAGVAEALRDIADVREHRNPELEILGVVFNNVDGRAKRLLRELDELVEEKLPGRACRTKISQAVIVPTLSGRGRTLFHDPRTAGSQVAGQYKRLAAEIERRALNRDEFLLGGLSDVEPAATLRLCSANDRPGL